MKRHLPCEYCGSRDNAYQYPDGIWCFGCKRYTPNKTSINNVKETLHGTKNTTGKSYSIPTDCSFTIPPVPYLWLSNYGLTNDEIQRNNIKWSESKKSLVFPIYNNSELVFWQERKFGTDKRWISHGSKPDAVLGAGDPLVLVEDIISAIRVSKVTACKPLFGSAINVNIFLRIKEKYSACKIWLDYDKAKDSIKYATQGSMFIPTQSIITIKDPKCYTTKEIKEYVI